MSSESDETKKSITNSLSLSKLAGNKISKSNTISYFNSFHFDKHFSQAKASLNIPVHQRGILFCFVLFNKYGLFAPSGFSKSKAEEVDSECCSSMKCFFGFVFKET